MSNPADSSVQNLLPVQAYFDTNGNFQTFIGQNKPFYATTNPDQSGLHITNSTIDSTTIGATTPSAGAFTNISTATGTITSPPSSATDIVNYLALQSYAVGISWKAPVTAATNANITLSGTQTIDGVALVAGNTVLVKNQSTSSENGIYTVNAGAWTYATGCTTWDQYVSALVFVEYGAQSGSAWYCTAQPGGTLGSTAMSWSNFSTAANYTAGTGLTLSGYQFSITPVGTAGTYGSATQTPVITTNASGQVSSVTNTTITPAVGSITGLGTGVATFLATPSSANLASAVTDETGSGALVFANSPTLVTPILGTPQSGNFSTGTFTWPTFNQNTSGNAATATTATTATNLAGGANGSIAYQSGSGATTMLAAGINGQVLTLASGVPSWATPTTGTVTSVGGTGTVSGIFLSGTVTSSGNLTLGGSLDLSSPPAIGGTTPAAITGTTVTANTKFVGPYLDAASSAGGALRNASGVSQIQWGSGGGSNVSIDVSANLNGTNAQIDISPTGTGHVHINPTGSGSVQVNPTAVGTIDNMTIGATTPKNASFVDLSVTGTVSFDGSQGTSGQVLTSAGSGNTPTWTTLGYATITDDTTTNATRYPLFAAATTGNLTTEYTSSTKFQFNPSTGTLTATKFSGALANALTAGTGMTATATYDGSAAITFNATGTTINSQTNAYTLVASDAGKTISITTGGVTVDNSVMSAGNIVSIYNNSGSSQTITQGSGVTLQWAGQASSTTGNRTLGLYGLATIVFISASTAVITGSGLT